MATIRTFSSFSFVIALQLIALCLCHNCTDPGDGGPPPEKEKHQGWGLIILLALGPGTVLIGFIVSMCCIICPCCPQYKRWHQPNCTTDSEGNIDCIDPEEEEKTADEPPTGDWSAKRASAFADIAIIEIQHDLEAKIRRDIQAQTARRMSRAFQVDLIMPSGQDKF